MNAIELRQQVLQEVVSLMDDDVAMMRLQSFLSTLKEEEEGFERIPGLPYTEEERRAAIQRAEEDVRLGRTHTHDEVVAKMDKLIKEWI